MRPGMYWGLIALAYFGGTAFIAALWGFLRDFADQKEAARRQLEWLREGRWTEFDDDAAYQSYVDQQEEGP